MSIPFAGFQSIGVRTHKRCCREYVCLVGTAFGSRARNDYYSRSRGGRTESAASYACFRPCVKPFASASDVFEKDRLYLLARFVLRARGIRSHVYRFGLIAPRAFFQRGDITLTSSVERRRCGIGHSAVTSGPTPAPLYLCLMPLPEPTTSPRRPPSRASEGFAHVAPCRSLGMLDRSLHPTRISRAVTRVRHVHSFRATHPRWQRRSPMTGQAPFVVDEKSTEALKSSRADDKKTQGTLIHSSQPACRKSTDCSSSAGFFLDKKSMDMGSTRANLTSLHPAVADSLGKR